MIETFEPLGLFAKRAAFLLALAALASCSGGKQEKVRIWTTGQTDAISAQASRLGNVRVEESASGKPWAPEMGSQEGPDLAYVELGAEFSRAAAAGKLLDISKLRPRAYWPGFRDTELSTASGGVFFLPAAVQLWGLWYNIEVLEKAGLALPKTLGELDAAFNALMGKGVLPLALGANSGWPALAWVALLDMRYNGADAYARLVEGKRHLDDPSLLEVYATLARWRNQGWIDPEASGKGWAEAFQKVEWGQAAFTLMSASAISRAKKPESLGFIALPERDTGTRRGELAVVSGFCASASSSLSQAALSVADAYVRSGAKGETSNDYLMPAISRGAGASDAKSGVKTTQAQMLGKAKGILPQLDRFLPMAVANSVSRTMRDFFAKGSVIDPIGLSQAMKKAENSQ